MSFPASRPPRREGVARFVLAGVLVGAAGLSGAAAGQSAVGRAAPDCELALRGEPLPGAMRQFHGSVVYLDFWASWCAPCLLSFPFMNGLQQDFQGKGLKVLAVNMDRKPEDAARFLSRHPAGFPVALGDNAACARRFGVEAMPTSFIIDRNGTIRRVHGGFRPGEEPKLRAWIAEAVAEPPR